MAFFRHYLCPDCGGTFRWLHHPSTDPPPHYCPLCGADMEAEPVFVPAAPHIGRSIGKTADAVYRQMEQAGAAHAEMAAELGGGTAADYQALKITDLPDYLRPGDVAARPLDNPVTQAMANSGQNGLLPGSGFQSFASVGSGMSSVGQGPYPHRGEQMRQQLVSGHQERQRAVEAQGTRAK
jgi:hypothetical protein